MPKKRRNRSSPPNGDSPTVGRTWRVFSILTKTTAGETFLATEAKAFPVWRRLSTVR
jgi:hypothetical protein